MKVFVMLSVLLVLGVAGLAHSLDGSIVVWGSNTYGQHDVPAPNMSFVSVEAGWGHSLGLKEDGSIVAWEWNNQGQCNVPSPNTDFVAISCGYLHSLGLKEDGSIVGWEWNESGQCNVPPSNEGFVVVAAGGYASYGLHDNNTGIEDDPSPLNILRIGNVYPNPFSGTTSVVFQSPELASVTLEVYDVSGRLVKSQELGALQEGQQTVLWDGSSSNGSNLANGVYIIRLACGFETSSTACVILLR